MITTITVSFDVSIEVDEHDDFSLTEVIDNYSIEEVIEDQLDTRATNEKLLNEYRQDMLDRTP